MKIIHIALTAALFMTVFTGCALIIPRPNRANAIVAVPSPEQLDDGLAAARKLCAAERTAKCRPTATAVKDTDLILISCAAPSTVQAVVVCNRICRDMSAQGKAKIVHLAEAPQPPSDPPEPETYPTPLVLIDTNQRIFANGEVVTLEQLPARLHKLLPPREDSRVRFAADPNTPTDVFLPVMQTIAEMGYILETVPWDEHRGAAMDQATPG